MNNAELIAWNLQMVQLGDTPDDARKFHAETAHALSVAKIDLDKATAWTDIFREQVQWLLGLKMETHETISEAKAIAQAALNPGCKQSTDVMLHWIAARLTAIGPNASDDAVRVVQGGGW